MLSFILRRLAVGVVVLLGATFIVFVLVSYATDPLAAVRASNLQNKAQIIQQRTELLHLDMPVVLRFFMWLGLVWDFLRGGGTLGTSFAKQTTVYAQLQSAVPTTIKLVLASLLIAVLLGVVVGITTALRQYSAFDYITTFFTFLFYSLPAFWVAVLLKEFGAIKFNDFLADPRIPPWVVVLIGLAGFGLATLVTGGRWSIRLLSGAVAGVAVALTALYVSLSGFLLTPGLGVVGVGLSGLGVAAVVTAIATGFGNRRALYSALTTALIGTALYFPLQFAFVNPTPWLLLGLWVSAGVVGALVGLAFGGPDKGLSARGGAITAMGMAVFVFADRLMQTWPAYVNSPRVKGRPIGTMGAVTPELGGNFWFGATDMLTHLILPTTALVLITFASYTRYTRASMLEVMNADYIRTARAKGLTERTVVVRHAFRNALIPLATVVPIDIAAVLGGAIITERIFSWRGMGTMFIDAMNEGDLYPIMGYFVVTAALFIAANIGADLVYAGLDPRIRVNA